MNLVKQITDQLSGGVLNQLGSLLGTDSATTERAATAAVPSLLAALAKMSSSDDGARKLSNALGGFDSNAFSNIGNALTDNASSFLGKGTFLLGSLFGDSMVSGLASMLGRLTGVNSGITKNLLGYLLPVVLAKVAGPWKQQGGTAQALKSLFADQRDSINAAVPAGFSFADIPTAGETRTTEYPSTRKTYAEPVAAKSPAAWLVPSALALLAGLFLWRFLTKPNEVQRTAEKTAQTAKEVTSMKPVAKDVDLPNVTDVRNNVVDLFKSIDTSFADIKDAASAEHAMPALQELSTKIDTIGQILSRLPAASKTELLPTIEDHVKAVTEKAQAASSIDGASSQFKSLVQLIIDKLSKWIATSLK